MASMTKRVQDRLAAAVGKYQPILSLAREEPLDTARRLTLVNDLLHDVFGYKPLFEITREPMLHGPDCDLALILAETVAVLIKLQPADAELADDEMRVVVDYARREGVEWLALTDAARWRIHRVSAAPSGETELVVEFDLTRIDPKNTEQLHLLFPLTKEGCAKGALTAHREWRHALARTHLGAAILREPVVQAIRRELKHLAPTVRLELEHVRNALKRDLIPPDVLADPQFAAATAALATANSRPPATAPELSPAETVEPEIGLSDR